MQTEQLKILKYGYPCVSASALSFDTIKREVDTKSSDNFKFVPYYTNLACMWTKK